jgi:hypothetical protein
MTQRLSRPIVLGTTLEEEALASGLVGVDEFDSLVCPAAILAPDA